MVNVWCFLCPELNSCLSPVSPLCFVKSTVLHYWFSCQPLLCFSVFSSLWVVMKVTANPLFPPSTLPLTCDSTLTGRASGDEPHLAAASDLRVKERLFLPQSSAPCLCHTSLATPNTFHRSTCQPVTTPDETDSGFSGCKVVGDTTES